MLTELQSENMKGGNCW